MIPANEKPKITTIGIVLGLLINSNIGRSISAHIRTVSMGCKIVKATALRIVAWTGLAYLDCRTKIQLKLSTKRIETIVTRILRKPGFVIKKRSANRTAPNTI